MSEHPASERTALAGLAAVAASGLSGAVIVQIMIPLPWLGLQLFVVAFVMGTIIALLHAAFLGGTAYVLLIDRWPVRWGNAAATGALVGAVPTTLLSLAVAGTQPAAFGLGPTLFCGFCGLIGGLAFRAVRGRDPRDEIV